FQVHSCSFFFSSRRRHTRWPRDWSSDVCSSDLFRNAGFYNDRLREVPNRLLRRWVASRREHGALTLDDLVEIAQLPDAQLDSHRSEERRVGKECGADVWL